MSKYNVSIRTLHFNSVTGHLHSSEYRKESMLTLKQGETFNFLNLNLTAKYPLSGFITGKPQSKDIIVDNNQVGFTVGKVDAFKDGLFEVELISKIPIVSATVSNNVCAAGMDVIKSPMKTAIEKLEKKDPWITLKR